MEKPKCRLCFARHWSTEPHVFAGSEPEKSPLAVAVKKITVPRTPKKIEPKVPPAPSIVVGYDFKAAAACPECAERRRKDAERVQRWRAKKK